MLLLLLQLLLLAGAAHSELLVDCDTTKGRFTIELFPEWAPLGVERFLTLVDEGFFNQPIPLFRCMEGFLCQFGYLPAGGSAKRTRASETALLDDDAALRRRFEQGYVSFAGSGPNTRTSHLFVTLGENVETLGREDWETPIGRVTRDTFANTVAKWETVYDDMYPYNAAGVDIERLEEEEGYLQKHFPKLDYLTHCERRSREGL